MNEDQQNFDSLRRLLALKRHEVPPPGYFDNFSRRVIARIHAGEAEESAGSLAGLPWLLRWLQSLATQPVFAGGFATALCLLLLFGAVMAQRPESVSQAFLQPAPRVATSPTSLPLVATTAPMAPVALQQPVGQIMIDNSTNPVINFAAAPSGQMPTAQFVNFPISDNQ